MTALLLINPASGGVARLGPDVIKDLVREHLLVAGHDLEIVEGTTPELIEVATQSRDRFDLVLPAGGDGTVAAIAGELRHATASMLCLPCGTVNLFCRDLGIPLDLAAALQACLAGSVKQVDVGLANDRAFINNLVVGAYAQFAEIRETIRSVESLSELGAAVGSALETVMNTEVNDYRLRIDGQTERTTTNTIGIFNNPVTGSLNMLPFRQSMTTGQLGIYVTEARTALDFAGVLATFARGGVDADDAIVEIPGSSCLISSDKGSVLYSHDGDPLEVAGTLSCRIDAASLKVLCPA
jgi:diacylglycerol kinase family enzyme